MTISEIEYFIQVSNPLGNVVDYLDDKGIISVQCHLDNSITVDTVDGEIKAFYNDVIFKLKNENKCRVYTEKAFSDFIKLSSVNTEH